MRRAETTVTASTDTTDFVQLPWDTILQLMKYEDHRRASFNRWPVKGISTSEMAAAGFFYLHQEDIVVCPFCMTRASGWRPGDRSLERHRRASPNCPYVRGKDCGNVPRAKSKEPRPLLDIGLTTSGNVTRYPANYLSLSDMEREHLMKMEDHRLQTFKYWPGEVDPTELAAAGFYYTGTAKEVKCAFCNGVVAGWSSQDKPMDVHARAFPACKFVLQQDVGNVGLSQIHYGAFVPNAAKANAAGTATYYQPTTPYPHEVSQHQRKPAGSPGERPVPDIFQRGPSSLQPEEPSASRARSGELATPQVTSQQNYYGSPSGQRPQFPPAAVRSGELGAADAAQRSESVRYGVLSPATSQAPYRTPYDVPEWQSGACRSGEQVAADGGTRQPSVRLQQQSAAAAPSAAKSGELATARVTSQRDHRDTSDHRPEVQAPINRSGQPFAVDGVTYREPSGHLTQAQQSLATAAGGIYRETTVRSAEQLESQSISTPFGRSPEAAAWTPPPDHSQSLGQQPLAQQSVSGAAGRSRERLTAGGVQGSYREPSAYPPGPQQATAAVRSSQLQTAQPVASQCGGYGISSANQQAMAQGRSGELVGPSDGGNRQPSSFPMEPLQAATALRSGQLQAAQPVASQLGGYGIPSGNQQPNGEGPLSEMITAINGGYREPSAFLEQPPQATAAVRSSQLAAHATASQQLGGHGVPSARLPPFAQGHSREAIDGNYRQPSVYLQQPFASAAAAAANRSGDLRAPVASQPHYRASSGTQAMAAGRSDELVAATREAERDAYDQLGMQATAASDMMTAQRVSSYGGGRGGNRGPSGQQQAAAGVPSLGAPSGERVITPQPSDQRRGGARPASARSLESQRQQQQQIPEAGSGYYANLNNLPGLTPEEEAYLALMKNEANRLESFNNWPSPEIITAQELAAAGFYYAGEEDYTSCPYCNMTLSGWLKGDNALSMHIKHNAECAYLDTLPPRAQLLASALPGATGLRAEVIDASTQEHQVGDRAEAEAPAWRVPPGMAEAAIAAVGLSTSTSDLRNDDYESVAYPVVAPPQLSATYPIGGETAPAAHLYANIPDLRVCCPSTATMRNRSSAASSSPPRDDALLTAPLRFDEPKAVERAPWCGSVASIHSQPEAWLAAAYRSTAERVSPSKQGSVESSKQLAGAAETSGDRSRLDADLGRSSKDVGPSTSPSRPHAAAAAAQPQWPVDGRSSGAPLATPVSFAAYEQRARTSANDRAASDGLAFRAAASGHSGFVGDEAAAATAATAAAAPTGDARVAGSSKTLPRMRNPAEVAAADASTGRADGRPGEAYGREAPQSGSASGCILPRASPDDRSSSTWQPVTSAKPSPQERTSPRKRSSDVADTPVGAPDQPRDRPPDAPGSGPARALDEPTTAPSAAERPREPLAAGSDGGLLPTRSSLRSTKADAAAAIAAFGRASNGVGTQEPPTGFGAPGAVGSSVAASSRGSQQSAALGQGPRSPRLGASTPAETTREASVVGAGARAAAPTAPSAPASKLNGAASALSADKTLPPQRSAEQRGSAAPVERPREGEGNASPATRDISVSHSAVPTAYVPFEMLVDRGGPITPAHSVVRDKPTRPSYARPSADAPATAAGRIEESSGASHSATQQVGISPQTYRSSRYLASPCGHRLNREQVAESPRSCPVCEWPIELLSEVRASNISTAI